MANPEVEYAKQRAGGWKEVTSPDGRLTMYVSPEGERLSKQEFADRYPQGAGSPDYLAHMGANDIMSGRAAAPITNGDPNIKAGIVLVPGRKVGFGLVSKPSTKFHVADERLQEMRNSIGERDREVSGEPNAFMRELRDIGRGHDSKYMNTIAQERSAAFNEYRQKEGVGGGAPDADWRPREAQHYDAALRRGQGIPFPDRQTPIRNNPPRSDEFKGKLIEEKFNFDKRFAQGKDSGIPLDMFMEGFEGPVAPIERQSGSKPLSGAQHPGTPPWADQSIVNNASQEAQWAKRQAQDAADHEHNWAQRYEDWGRGQGEFSKSPGREKAIQHTMKKRGK